MDFRADFGSILGLIYYEKSGNIWLIMGIEATTMDDYMDTPFFASIFDYERSIGVHFTSSQIEVPSGKSQFFMGKSTILWPFSIAIYVCLPGRVYKHRVGIVETIGFVIFLVGMRGGFFHGAFL